MRARLIAFIIAGFLIGALTGAAILLLTTPRGGQPVESSGTALVGGPFSLTGTDGKTTTTLMARAMLESAGLRAVDAGNTDVPLVEALDLDVDVFVVECTSFRLAWTSTFRGEAAAWLTLAPDHLNWHTGMDTYEAAKARIFSQQRPGDAAIGFTGTDLETASRERIPILSILLNNHAMAIELPIMPEATAKYRATDISGDYAAFARSLGCHGERVTQAAEIVPALRRAIAEQRLSLSPREQESLNLAFEGLTARETALRMECSERTVNYHLANAMAKLQTDNKLAAVQRACWLGLI